MKKKHFIVCIHFYEEEEPDFTENTPRLFYAPSMEQAKKRLAGEFNKTIAYAKEKNIDTTENNRDFSAWMGDENDGYEIQADGFFYEKGEILEAGEA